MWVKLLGYSFAVLPFHRVKWLVFKIAVQALAFLNDIYDSFF